jgi:DNA-binding XRE family transcriptional regulator
LPVTDAGNDRLMSSDSTGRLQSTQCSPDGCGRPRLHTIGANITRLRRLNEMTQDELASAIHKHRVTVNRIEQGLLVPSLRTLFSIATALHCNLGALFEGT